MSSTATLAEAARALQQGEVDRAEELLRSMLASHPDHPDCLHLLGLVRKAQGDPGEAEACLRRSLAGRPRQPTVLGNLGNLLRGMGRDDEAERAYREALALTPRFPDALKNLGLLLASRERDAEAVALLRRAVALRADDAAAWITLGQCQRRLGDYQASVESFERALEIAPDHVNALAGLGQTLRMIGRPADAAACFDRALPRVREPVELLLARADVAADQGACDEALERYREVVERFPTHVGAHVQLNELLWQTGAVDRYGDSLAQALERYPDQPPLLAAWVRGLISTGQSQRALDELEVRSELVARQPGLLVEHGRCLASLGRAEAAEVCFRKALALAPGDADLNLEFARFAVNRGDYPGALAALEVVESSRPEDQLMWACRGVCWRLMEDPRAGWLNDESRLVLTREIPCPPGYGNLDAFLQALAEVLADLHWTRSAPAHQSVRGGTQTAPRLFYRPERIIQDLRQALAGVVADYIASLPADPQHPLVRRRRRDFYFSGSWSVRLRSGGYHVNHVHPQGWISSSHYVTVPRDLGESRAHPAGWLKLGETGLDLGDLERVSRLVKPVPGEVTLFPSYFWHGTVPFASDEPRMTTPFDVSPSG